MTATSVPVVPVERSAVSAARRGHHPRTALAIIAAAQLMVVLDATIVNIALPHIQSALHFSTTGLSWVLNAYTLTFGGLLMLGGRAGDILGRRRVFIFGILLFTLASFLGGLATNSSWLLAARALQGAGGAIASPTALSLITTNFAEGAERNRAFGVSAAVSGSGAAIGLLAGGMLTSWLSWRWVLFVNVPIGLLVAVVAPLYINESKPNFGQFDLAGAVASTAGMSAVVYGFIRAAQEGWRDPWTLGSFGAAVVLLAAFVGIEMTTKQPIMPLRMFRDPNRSGSYAVMLCLAAALFSMFFFLTLFVQNILGYSPLKSSLAFLPVSATIGATAQIASRRLLSVGPKPFMVAGAALATGGLAWLSQLSVTSSYAVGTLGPMLLFAAGMGFLFVPLTITAVNGVDPREAGAASGLLNVMEQVGGSLGLAILVTVFGTASRNEGRHQVTQFLAHATPQMKRAFAQNHDLPPKYAAEVLAHGISTAFGAGVVFTAIALVVSIVVIRATARTGAPVELRDVEVELARLVAERDELREESARLRRRLEEADAGAGEAGRRMTQSHEQAVGLLARAQQTADQCVAEAEQYSCTLTQDARRLYEDIVADARARAAAILAEAAAAAGSRHDQDKDRAALAQEVAYLETFGKACRIQLRSFLEALIRQIEQEWGQVDPAAVAEQIAAGPADFDGADMKRLRGHRAKLLGAVTGGPDDYQVAATSAGPVPTPPPSARSERL